MSISNAGVSWNMRHLGSSDLAGPVNLGEGIGLQRLPNGRRIMYLAHDQGPKDFSIVDVTDVKKPKLLAQAELSLHQMR